MEGISVTKQKSVNGIFLETQKSLNCQSKAEEGRSTEDDLDLTKDGSLDIFGKPARRSKTGGWKSASFVLAYQALGTVTYYGVATNLVLYLMEMLNLSNAAAATTSTNWYGTAYATSLLGAFLGDAYLGRYWASVIFVGIHFLGTVLLTMQAAMPSLRPKKCALDATNCQPATMGQKAFLYAALYISALGAGGHQPCMTALGADQFDEEYPPEAKKKGSYFSYFFIASLLGSLFVTIVLSYVEESYSYAIGFGVCSITIAIAGLLFVAGVRYYRHFRPSGNPFSRAIQVIVAAVRKRKVAAPSDSEGLHELEDNGAKTGQPRRMLHTNSLRFLDKAATPTEDDKLVKGALNPWTLCTVTQVEEVKCIILLVPIWICSCIHQMVLAQVTTTFVEQGSYMDTKMGSIDISPASLFTFYTIATIVATLVYETQFVRIMRRLTGLEKGITMLQRMGIGLVIILGSIAAGATVEMKRLQIVKNHGLVHDEYAKVPMSIFWQVPQYSIAGVAEVFTYVAQTEFFYDQVPEGVRGLGSAFAMASVAVGNYLSSLLVTVINRVSSRNGHTEWISDNLNEGRLDLFFWLIAVISFVNIGYFLICTRAYRYINRQELSDPTS